MSYTLYMSIILAISIKNHDICTRFEEIDYRDVACLKLLDI